MKIVTSKFYLVQMYKQQLQKRIQHFIWDMYKRPNTAAKAKRQLFWWGLETTEWTYERAGYWLLAARRDNQGGKCFWWWCRYICEGTVQLNLADEDSFREREGKPRKRIWWPTFNQDENILTLACADDDEVATTCENHTHVLIWRRTWKLSKSFQKQQKWKYLCHLWNHTS